VIGQNLFFNQTSLNLEYLTFQVIMSLRKWNVSLHHFNFMRQVLVTVRDFSLEEAFLFVGATACQLLENPKLVKKSKNFCHTQISWPECSQFS
jgi:hypothetical protein